MNLKGGVVVVFNSPDVLGFLFSLFLGLYEEIRQCRQACGDAHMKTILGTGELGSLTNVYKASLVAMMAGNCSTYGLSYKWDLQQNVCWTIFCNRLCACFPSPLYHFFAPLGPTCQLTFRSSKRWILPEMSPVGIVQWLRIFCVPFAKPGVLSVDCIFLAR